MRLAWAAPADVPDLARVHALAFETPWREAAFAELLASPGVFGLVARTGAAQGLILCRQAAGEMEILTLAVAPDARRRGIAQALVAAGLAHARTLGAAAAFLEVAVDNAAALGLYAAAGFRQAGLRRGYYARSPGPPGDALVLRLDLGAKVP